MEIPLAKSLWKDPVLLKVDRAHIHQVVVLVITLKIY